MTVRAVGHAAPAGRLRPRDGPAARSAATTRHRRAGRGPDLADVAGQELGRLRPGGRRGRRAPPGPVRPARRRQDHAGRAAAVDPARAGRRRGAGGHRAALDRRRCCRRAAGCCAGRRSRRRTTRASVAALVGGGSGLARPGALSLAHRGVLFLDEAPEFAHRRAARRCGSRWRAAGSCSAAAGGGTEYPARVQLVLAANPCPCAQAGRRPALRVHAAGPPPLPRPALRPAARPDRHPGRAACRCGAAELMTDRRRRRVVGRRSPSGSPRRAAAAAARWAGRRLAGQRRGARHRSCADRRGGCRRGDTADAARAASTAARCRPAASTACSGWPGPSPTSTAATGPTGDDVDEADRNYGRETASMTRPSDVDADRLARVALDLAGRAGQPRGLRRLVRTHGRGRPTLDRLLRGEQSRTALRATVAARLGGRRRRGGWPARGAASARDRLGARLVMPGRRRSGRRTAATTWPRWRCRTRPGRIDRDDRPPLCLWVRGGWPLGEALDRSVAVVGARAATAYGAARRHRARRTAWPTRGWTVVSGGAFGIDAAAHRARSAAGGADGGGAGLRGRPAVPGRQHRAVRADRRDGPADQRVAAGRRAAAAPLPDPQPGDRRGHRRHRRGRGGGPQRRRADAGPGAGAGPARRWWCPGR